LKKPSRARVRSVLLRRRCERFCAAGREGHPLRTDQLRSEAVGPAAEGEDRRPSAISTGQGGRRAPASHPLGMRLKPPDRDMEDEAFAFGSCRRSPWPPPSHPLRLRPAAMSFARATSSRPRPLKLQRPAATSTRRTRSWDRRRERSFKPPRNPGRIGGENTRHNKARQVGHRRCRHHLFSVTPRRSVRA
jgi:hypothetical protein